MKHLKSLILLGLIISLVSCSSSDDSGNNNPQTITGDYFPSVFHDLWNYNVVNSSQNDPAGNFTATDNLVVVSETGNDFTLQVNDGIALANGTLNALLVNGTLTKSNTNLVFNGVLDGPPGYENFIDQQIELNDVVLYDLNASNDAELSSNSNTIQQDLTVGEDTFPLTIDYTFTSTKIGFSNSETVNGEAYSNVVKTRMVLNLRVSTSYDFGSIIGVIDINVINPQDVLTIEAWYAQDVGLIAAYSISSYSLNEELLLLVGDIGVPESDSSENRQELDSYSLN